MFEERGADETIEFRPYRATAWQRVPEVTADPGDPVDVPVRETIGKTGTSFQMISDILKPIRKIVSDHENWLLIAVVLILVCDCDDDLELLVAAAILLLPMVRSLL